ncbi:MAG TPA: lipid-binding SYLF domain-containing protein [Steroidobacteraceae bacterium]|nr:lipid-binding SYLF domain-containing protein [Steroidobacteraceae bacterium]
MNIRKALLAVTALAASGLLSLATVGTARADAGDEGRLLLATQVLEQIQGMPDQRIPDYLLARAYGIAVLPNVTKVAFIFGGRYGRGVLVVRKTLNSPWSNPAFITLAGGSWGLQIGAQSSDIVLVFTTKEGIEGITGGKLTLGADASVAAGPVGRQGSAATDINFGAEIYSYARTRGLFAGIALDGSVIRIDSGDNARFYGRSDVSASDIFAGTAPTAPPAAQRFLVHLAQVTGSSVRGAAAPQAGTAAGSAPAPQPPAQVPRSYPLQDQSASSAPPP